MYSASTDRVSYPYKTLHTAQVPVLRVVSITLMVAYDKFSSLTIKFGNNFKLFLLIPGLIIMSINKTISNEIIRYA